MVYNHLLEAMMVLPSHLKLVFRAITFLLVLQSFNETIFKYR